MDYDDDFDADSPVSSPIKPTESQVTIPMRDSQPPQSKPSQTQSQTTNSQSFKEEEDNEASVDEHSLGVDFKKATSMRKTLRKILRLIKEEVGEEPIKNRDMVSIVRIFGDKKSSISAKEERDGITAMDGTDEG